MKLKPITYTIALTPRERVLFHDFMRAAFDTDVDAFAAPVVRPWRDGFTVALESGSHYIGTDGELHTLEGERSVIDHPREIATTPKRAAAIFLRAISADRR